MSKVKSTSFSVLKTVRDLARGLSNDLIRIRRHLHRHPELSDQEFETTKYLSEELAGIGLTPRPAQDHRGVWADLGEGSYRVVLRGDIDALPIATEVQAEYRSQVAGVMHACGHDAHAAMTFGAAAILHRLEQFGKLPQSISVRAVFQPAEETSNGAPHMIHSGVLDGVASAMALHVDPTRPLGTVGVRSGVFTAGCDAFHITFSGRAGHGARPHLTDDVVAAAAAWINQVYTRVPRSHDALDPVVVNVGAIHGGSAPNVIPNSVDIAGTVRATSLQGRQAAMETIAKINQSLRVVHGCQIETKYEQHTPPMHNDKWLSERMRVAAGELLGESNVHPISEPSMGAEDFAFFAQQVPAAMIRLGIKGSRVGHEMLHTPKFDIDEAALAIGSAVLALSVIEIAESLSTEPRNQTCSV
ncbi:amidohydrolase [Roseiconus nitratireducens]|uniref:Amidohydrolase n=1 Tax=Roseiconus nitratireducens TaxID=2605748 RepID=A0A5M6D1T7_9BACT|nr:amidohydrolase [Roseiconus nitratireducens]KAA5539085.1 amidohydrolase [Roseiconus nitratireducens]